MNSILQKLWPIIGMAIASAVADGLKALAKTLKVPLSDTTAVEIGALIAGWLGQLIARPATPALVKQTAALQGKPVLGSEAEVKAAILEALE